MFFQIPRDFRLEFVRTGSQGGTGHCQLSVNNLRQIDRSLTSSQISDQDEPSSIGQTVDFLVQNRRTDNIQNNIYAFSSRRLLNIFRAVRRGRVDATFGCQFFSVNAVAKTRWPIALAI